MDQWQSSAKKLKALNGRNEIFFKECVLSIILLKMAVITSEENEDFGMNAEQLKVWIESDNF